MFGQAKDPQVIDEPLILEALREKGEKETNFLEVKYLCLSDRSRFSELDFRLSALKAVLNL